jgi:hypothetical protein
MIKEILAAPKELQRLGQEIKKHTKEIREGIRANGYCLDGICKEYRPVPAKRD